MLKLFAALSSTFKRSNYFDYVGPTKLFLDLYLTIYPTIFRYLSKNHSSRVQRILQVFCSHNAYLSCLHSGEQK